MSESTFAPSGPPDLLGQRMGELSTAHPWMDPDLVATLASSNHPTPLLHQVADTFKQTLQATWDGWHPWADDPVLYKRPSRSLAIRRYINGTLGPIPIESGSVKAIQAELQASGYGKELQTDGLWGPEWNAVWNSHGHDIVSKQLSGEHLPGDIGTSTSISKVANAGGGFGLHKAIHMTVAFVKALPGDVRDVLADTASGFTMVGQLARHPSALLGNPDAGDDVVHAGQRTRANIEGALRNPNAARYEANVGVAQAVQDIGTVLLLQSLVAAPGKITARQALARAAAKDIGEGVARSAAERGPGVIARSLGGRTAAEVAAKDTSRSALKPIVRRAVGGALVGGTEEGIRAGVQGRPILPAIEKGVAIGAGVGVAIPERFLTNIPIASRVGPWVSKMADADGLYYRTRGVLALPYRYRAVQLAGEVAGRTSVFGAEARGVAALSPQEGSLAQARDDTHFLDDITDSAKRMNPAFGHVVGTLIDNADFLLHAPMHGPGAPSRIVGEQVQAIHDGTQSLLGKTGLAAEFERAYGVGIKRRSMLAMDRIIDMAGGQDRANRWLNHQLMEASINEAAVREVIKPGSDIPTARNFFDAVREVEHRIWGSPDERSSALQAMVTAQPGTLEAAIKRQITASKLSPTAYLRRQAGAYLDAADILKHDILPHEEHLITPSRISAMHARIEEEKVIAGIEGRAPNKIGFYNTPLERPNGSIGLMNVDRLDKVQAKAKITRLRAEYEAALAVPGAPEQAAAVDAVQHDVTTMLFHDLGQDGAKQKALYNIPKQLDHAESLSDNLAYPVYHTHDAPQALKDAVKAAEAKGYKPVFGTDIGWMHEDGLPRMAVTEGAVTRRRRWVENMGVNPTHIAQTDLGVDRYARIRLELQAAVDDGRIVLPPAYTVDSLMAHLTNDEIIGHTLPTAESVAFDISRRFHARDIRRLAADQHLTEEQAVARLKEGIARDLQLRDIPRKKIIEVLTSKDNVPWVTRAEQEFQGGVDAIPLGLMDRHSANETYMAIVRGAARTPARMTGWSRVEDMARMSFGFADKAIPGRAGESFANLPNRLVQLRNRFRFDLSPSFSLRRWAKTNAKLLPEGIVPQADVLGHLEKTGTYEKAHALIDRIEPLPGEMRKAYSQLAETERYIHGADMFGLYSERNWKAYAALELQKQGLDDAAIKTRLGRVFGYAKDGVAGRSAAERSANFVFFPFSFEKTLVRNFGGYLLDHPGQRILLTNAIQAYHDFNQSHQDGTNPLSASWIDEHLPLAKELLRLNAFGHGVSLGQLGGMNRPLVDAAAGGSAAVLNMFLPQSIPATKENHALLTRLVPAWKDLQRVITEGGDQARIAAQAVYNSVDAVTREIRNVPRGPLNPRGAAMTANAQRREASKLRNGLLTAASDVLDYNERHQGLENKYRFAEDDSIPKELRGEPIDREHIAKLVQLYYPAYNPDAAVEFAQQRRSDITDFIDNAKGTERYAMYRQWFDSAATVSRNMSQGKYGADQEATLTQQFRVAAQAFSESDAAFFRLYKKHFTYYFGPLEKP